MTSCGGIKRQYDGQPKIDSNGTSIIDLNDDCLREIFKYFDQYELGAVADVCQIFRQNAQAEFNTKRFQYLDINIRARDQYRYDYKKLAAKFVQQQHARHLRLFGATKASIRVRCDVTYQNDCSSNDERNNKAITIFTTRVAELMGRYCSGATTKLLLYNIYITKDIANKMQPVFTTVEVVEINDVETGMGTSLQRMLTGLPRLNSIKD